MSAIPNDTPDRPLNSLGQRQQATGPDALVSPGGGRRRFLNRKTATLGVVVACAAGFLAGIEIEKSQVSGTASAATAPAGTTGGAATGAGTRPGFGLTGGGAGGGSAASFGTVASVNGNTIYVMQASGNTVKVTLSSATKITKSQSTSKSSLHPGDALVVQGATGKNGTLAATSVSDSGARTARPGGGAGSGGSTTTSNSAGAAGTGTTG
jgi:uncharacterized protein (DUF2147 family)